MTWPNWLKAFDQNNLAFLYQERTAAGKPSRFNKLISRDEARDGGGGGGRAGTSTRTAASGRSSARATSSRRAAAARGGGKSKSRGSRRD